MSPGQCHSVVVAVTNRRCHCLVAVSMAPQQTYVKSLTANAIAKKKLLFLIYTYYIPYTYIYAYIYIYV